MHSRTPAAIYGCLIARKERVVCFQWRVLNGEEKAKIESHNIDQLRLGRSRSCLDMAVCGQDHPEKLGFYIRHRA